MSTTTSFRGLTIVAAMAAALVATTCEKSPTDLEGTTLAEGTWGGDDVAAIVQDSLLHVHVGSSRVDLQACKLEYSIVSPK